MPSNNMKDIRASCPKCQCSPEKIEIWNCGLIIRIRCPQCGFSFSDAVPEVNHTVEGLIAYWNTLSHD